MLRICFLLYVPQALQTLWGIVSAPHLLHFTRFGADIFQLALLLSLLALDDLFFGQMDISTPPRLVLFSQKTDFAIALDKYTQPAKALSSVFCDYGTTISVTAIPLFL